MGVVGCATTAPPAAPGSGSTAVPRAVITAVVAQKQAEAEQILVRATRPLQYTAFKLQDPLRLVVDIAEAQLGDLERPLPVADSLISRIEPVAFPDEHVVRLTLHLRQMVAHKIRVEREQLRIILEPFGEAAAASGPQEDRQPSSSVAQAAASDQPAAQTRTAAPPAEPSEKSSMAAPEKPPMTAPEKPPMAAPKMAGTTVEEVTFVSLPETSVLALQTSGAEPAVRLKQRQDPLRLLLEVGNATLGAGQERTEAVTDPGGVVTSLRVSQVANDSGSTVHVVAHLRQSAPFDIRQENGLVRLLITKPAVPAAATAPPAAPPVSPLTPGTTTAMTPAVSKPMPSAAATAPASVSAPPIASTSGMAPRQPGAGETAAVTLKDEGPKYTGEKVSLDFQNADINDILRLIAEVSGLNIIAGNDVQGTITTRMVDVPWDQALDVILKVSGLGQEREGNIIRVAPTTRFITERQERLQAQLTDDRVEPTITQLIPVNYADATALKTNFERLLSERGSINIDARTNTLIVTDTKKHIAAILELLPALDRQTPQVMIEARIVETSRNFLRDLGVQLGANYANTTDVEFPNRIGVSGSASDGNFLVDLPAAVGAGSGGAITFALAGASSLINLRLSALESTGQGKIISNPKVATLDNTEAKIQSGRKIPVQTVSAEGTKTEFFDANISLTVTPHVTPDGFINMKISATKDEADFGNAVQGIPTIITREATTEMLVKDNDTVVIGGLYSRSLSSNRNGVPWLSRVPIVGLLFQKTSASDDNDELLIFITPRIIQPPQEKAETRAAGAYGR